MSLVVQGIIFSNFFCLIVLFYSRSDQTLRWGTNVSRPLFLGSFRCWVRCPFVQGLCLIAKEMVQRSYYYIFYFIQLMIRPEAEAELGNSELSLISHEVKGLRVHVGILACALKLSICAKRRGIPF